jgi:membrane protein implicated in regulation of membrane protease activity
MPATGTSGSMSGRMAQATEPILDSTCAHVRFHGEYWRVNRTPTIGLETLNRRAEALF